jgi:hypothetical protein
MTRMRIYFEKKDVEAKQADKPEVSERPLSSKLFDALFGRRG